MTDPMGAGASVPRAFLRVGGMTLARHQLGVALALDCQRVVCLAREVTPDLIALQHDAEHAGARFHIVSGPRALAGLITANDDLLVLGEGLLADPHQAVTLLEPGHAVLVQPVESGVAAGYERIDLNRAGAGAMRIPGRLVEGLQDLPSDVDAQSALTRIALQAGVAMHEVPAAVRDGARWRLIRDENDAHAVESDWIRLHMGDRSSKTPAVLLSRLGLRALGPSLLHAGSGSTVVTVSALVLLLMAIGAGWFALATLGFLFCAAAAVMREGGAVLRRIERQSLNLPPAVLPRATVLGWLADLTLITVILLTTPPLPWDMPAQRAFAPAVLILMVRLLPRVVDPGLAPWIKDRALLATLLALAAGTGMLLGGVQLLAIALGIAGLLFPRGRRN